MSLTRVLTVRISEHAHDVMGMRIRPDEHAHHSMA
ncbi:UNVERIFIED_ORG: hypothetical protein ABIB19_003969 [Arthrobacter sp. UYEF10]